MDVLTEDDCILVYIDMGVFWGRLWSSRYAVRLYIGDMYHYMFYLCLYGPYMILSYTYVFGCCRILCGDSRCVVILLVRYIVIFLTDRCLEKFRNRENTGETLSVSFPDFRI